ncbi:uncharacterized protein PG986_003693 [Apiospora aurea]|uniref:Uncharacterized protein n=1 Tax=Apiospora aurea TaxID=335848 RepID=A0ABR1QSF0_9PEZI
MRSQTPLLVIASLLSVALGGQLPTLAAKPALSTAITSQSAWLSPSPPSSKEAEVAVPAFPRHHAAPVCRWTARRRRSSSQGAQAAACRWREPSREPHGDMAPYAGAYAGGD